MEPIKLASGRRTYSHIDMDERRKIERWLAAKISVDEIADKLGRHRSTIFRELKRNRFDDVEMPKICGYYCVTAEQQATRRRYNLRKLVRLPKLRDAIIERIKHGWSPQQIAGRLKLERGFDRGPVMYACHETIYRYAYSQDGQAIKLWRYLPEHRARRRPRGARRKYGRRFGPEVSILNRPDVVAKRREFGHWECDLIQFRKKYGNGNSTSLVERAFHVNLEWSCSHIWQPAVQAFEFVLVDWPHFATDADQIFRIEIFRSSAGTLNVEDHPTCSSISKCFDLLLHKNKIRTGALRRQIRFWDGGVGDIYERAEGQY